MASPKTKLAPEPVHLVHSRYVGLLRRIGAREVPLTVDALNLGPSSVAPRVHAELRRTFWHAFHRAYNRIGPRSGRSSPAKLKYEVFSADELDAHLKSVEGPLAIWSGSTWSEQLFLWWVCDAIVRMPRLAQRKLYLAEWTRELQTLGYAESLAPRSVRTAALQSAALARPLPRAMAKAGARLWQAFAEGDLGALQRHAQKAGAPVGPLPGDAAAFVPGLDAKSRLQLCAYDRALLGMFFDAQWHTPLSRIRECQTRDTFYWLMEFGDAFIPVRLAEWLAHPSGVLEARPLPGGAGPMNCVEYRLTPEGRRLVTAGLTSLAEAPPLTCGGFTSYAPDMKYVCVLEAEGWHFARTPRSLLERPVR